MSAQPETIDRPPSVPVAVTLPRCDACGDDASPYPDLPALLLCELHTRHLDRERRVVCGHGAGVGPMPRLSPFRLGRLAASFATYPHVVAKLEREAARL